MAPTGSTVLGVSNKALAQVKKNEKGVDNGEELETANLPRMTPELLQSICKERQMWMLPHLNTQLYLNYKGFLRIEGMEDYVNVRSLMLDNNNITKIEGLDRMTELRSLHLGGNRITEIEGLESNIDLRHLNIEGNAIRCVSNVRHLVNLESLNVSANRVENLEDLAELKELPSLINIDISANVIEEGEGVVEFWSEMQKLKVLRYHGNGGIRHVSHYRKRLINALPDLTYMDERPVFPVERKACKAWESGGLEAMHAAKKDFHRERHSQCGVDADRKELVTNMRKMAIERMDREAKEQKENEETARVGALKKNDTTPLGSGREAQDGDLAALAEYEKGWKQKVSLYGVEGVRTKIAQENGGKHMPKPSEAAAAAPAQRQHSADFDFAPAERMSFAPPSRTAATQEPATQTAPAAGRRQARGPVDVAGFRQSSTGQAEDYTERVFSVLGDDVDVSLGFSESAQGAGKAAAKDESVMPLIWENRQAETARAEADCMEQNMRAAKQFREEADAPKGVASFRSNGMDSLD